jgi:hypothetical protein
LVSSFQRRQPHPVLITLAPTNCRRTFASLNFGELSASFSGETVQFRCKRTPPWSSPRQALHRDGVGHANPTSTMSSSPTLASSSPTPVTPLQLRWALLSPWFLPGQRWAHYRVRLVDLVPFCHSRARLEVVPTKSLPFIVSLYVMFTVTMANSICTSFVLTRPQPPTAGQSHHRQQMCNAEPRQGNPTRWPPDLRSVTASWRPTSLLVPPPPADSRHLFASLPPVSTSCNPFYFLPPFCASLGPLSHPHHPATRTPVAPCVSCPSQDGGRR